MSLTNPNDVVTEERLAEFYGQILPYLGGMPEALANKFDKSELYSTDEKIVGCWTDGKPLYQKTIVTTTGPDANLKLVSIGASVDYGTVKSAVVTDTDGHYFNAYCTAMDNTNSLIRVAIFANNASANENMLRIDCTVSFWQNKPLWVTVQYTKTTDAANSFKYGTETDYSTDEKIVGTWIDGKPLYQKTFTGIKTISTSESTLEVSLDNTCDIIDWKGVVSPNVSNKRLYKFGYLNTAATISGGSIVSVFPENNVFYVRATTSFTDATYWLTVQYTKTTD